MTVELIYDDADESVYDGTNEDLEDDEDVDDTGYDNDEDDIDTDAEFDDDEDDDGEDFDDDDDDFDDDDDDGEDDDIYELTDDDDEDDPVITLDDGDEADFELGSTGLIPDRRSITVQGNIQFRERLGTGNFGQRHISSDVYRLTPKKINLSKDHHRPEPRSEPNKAPWLLTSFGIITALLTVGLILFLAFSRRYRRLKLNIQEKRQQAIASQRARMAQLAREKECGRLLDTDALLANEAVFTDSQTFIPSVHIEQASPDFHPDIGECFPNPSMTDSRQDRFNV